MSKSRLTRLIAMAALVCHGYFHVLGQEGGLNRDYYFDAISTSFYAVRSLDDGLVIVGQHGIDSSGWAGIFVLNIDTVGNIRSLDFHRYPEIEDDLLVNSFY
jgi:hypothetical protein